MTVLQLGMGLGLLSFSGLSDSGSDSRIGSGLG